MQSKARRRIEIREKLHRDSLEIAELAGQIADTLEQSPRSLEDTRTRGACKQMRKLSERARTGYVGVLVLGEGCNGKSTLVNALVGQPLLPSSAGMACTRNVVRVQLSSSIPEGNAEACVKDADGESRQITMEVIESRAKSSLAGSELIIKQHSQLMHGISLIDTPGDNQGSDQTQILLQCAKGLDWDILLVVCNLQAGMTENVKSRIQLLMDMHHMHTCIVVLNKMDQSVVSQHGSIQQDLSHKSALQVLYKHWDKQLVMAVLENSKPEDIIAEARKILSKKSSPDDHHKLQEQKAAFVDQVNSLPQSKLLSSGLNYAVHFVSAKEALDAQVSQQQVPQVFDSLRNEICNAAARVHAQRLAWIVAQEHALTGCVMGGHPDDWVSDGSAELGSAEDGAELTAQVHRLNALFRDAQRQLAQLDQES
eukprot:COSAG01_NODE_2440_length_7691_cov_12.311249_3_plen_425_part_00